MTNFVVEIISMLESTFTEPHSIRNSIQTSDGEIIRIDRKIWDASPVLRKHFVHGVSHKVVNVPKSSVAALFDAHRDGIFPPDFSGLLNLLALTSELELRDLTSKCFEALRKTEVFHEIDFPPECSTETVMRCFKALLDGPLRTTDIYEQQLSRIAKHCANNRDVMINAMNLVKQMLEKFININLEGIPINFNIRTVPAIIYQRVGKLQTAVIDGADIKPVNLFGERFSFETVRVESHFYLKYGAYLLYKSYKCVYVKNLQDDSEPTEKLNNCSILLTRRNSVLAVHREGSCHSILTWTNDEKFTKIYQTRLEIIAIEFECDESVLVVQLLGKGFLVFRLENHNLFLLAESEDSGTTKIFLSGRNMFLVESEVTCLGRRRISTRRIPTMDSENSSQLEQSEKSHDVESSAAEENAVIAGEIEFAGGNYFLTDRGSLKIVKNFPSLAETRTLMTEGELHALSELVMSP